MIVHVIDTHQIDLAWSPNRFDISKECGKPFGDQFPIVVEQANIAVCGIGSLARHGDVVCPCPKLLNVETIVRTPIRSIIRDPLLPLVKADNQRQRDPGEHCSSMARRCHSHKFLSGPMRGPIPYDGQERAR